MKYNDKKNDNIHKNEVQNIRWSDEFDKYRLAANITEYHIISKLILQRIIITNFTDVWTDGLTLNVKNFVFNKHITWNRT